MTTVPARPRYRWLDPEEVGTGNHCESNRHYGDPPPAAVRLFFGRLETLNLCGACYREGCGE